jgi:succinate-semialdehyde dehydrogenase
MSTSQSAVSIDPEIAALVSSARAAQAKFEAFSQEQVDAIVRDMGKYVYDNAEMLARMAVEETGIGNYEDKVLKKKGKARAIWNSLKGKKSRGIIGEDAENNMVFVAKPMGVVGAVTPITNPVVTPMCNGMFALKTGNAVIFAPHPKAQKCAEHLTEAFMDIVRKHGGPEDLIQVVRNGSITKTQQLMESVDVVVATGGGAMVKSAYSSGRPSYGVGAGNVPVIIDRGVDLGEAVDKIVTGAAFDNGIICSHEQFVLTPREQFEETVRTFVDTGKVWFTQDEDQIQKLRDVVFPGGQLNKDVVGITAREVGAMAGIDVPESARLIMLPAKGAGEQDILAREKLCPVIAILPYESFEDAVQKAKANLLVEGAGHSAALHSNDEENIRLAGLEAP